MANTPKKCIARDCGQMFDAAIPETRTNLRSFFMRYCPACRAKGNAGAETFVNTPNKVGRTRAARICREVEAAATWQSEHGHRGDAGSPLPNLLGGDAAAWINQNQGTFKAMVMRRVNLKLAHTNCPDYSKQTA